MQKHRINPAQPCSLKNQPALKLNPKAYQAYINRQYFYCNIGTRYKVYQLPCGCFLWHSKRHGRYLTTNPPYPPPTKN